MRAAVLKWNQSRWIWQDKATNFIAEFGVGALVVDQFVAIPSLFKHLNDKRITNKPWGLVVSSSGTSATVVQLIRCQRNHLEDDAIKPKFAHLGFNWFANPHLEIGLLRML